MTIAKELVTITLDAHGEWTGYNLASVGVVITADCPEHGRVGQSGDTGDGAAQAWRHIDAMHDGQGRIEGSVNVLEVSAAFLAAGKEVPA